MPFDPNYITKKNNDCVRMCIACVLDVHPRRVPFFEPGSKDQWGNYKNWLEEKHDMGIFFTEKFSEKINDLINNNRPWIAIVEPLTIPQEFKNKSFLHAVTMCGGKLQYDPAFQRVRRPKKIHYGAVIGNAIGESNGEEQYVLY